MKTKLKTLKDLSKGLLEYKSATDSNLTKAQKKFIKDMDSDKDIVPISDLKQEAIKWIKTITNSHPKDSLVTAKILFGEEYGDGFDVGERYGHLLSITYFIKHFFGISEEELKNGN